MVEKLILKSKTLLVSSLIGLILLFSFLPIGALGEKDIENSQTVLDRHDNLIAKFNRSKTTYTDLSKVPIELIHLILLSEDKRFFDHTGIDFIALSRALLENIKFKNTLYGASTLTQQLVRIKHNYPRKILLKPLVMLHSVKYEIFRDKGDILEEYLNRLPFSHQIKGIKEASHFYFNKDLSQLNLSEMSILAVLIKSPSYLSSLSGRNKLFHAKNSLLNRYFKKTNYETWQQDIFLKEKISLENNHVRGNAYLFLEYLKDKDENVLKTTLDLSMQKYLQALLKTHITRLKHKNVTNGAMLVVENKTGDVLAYVGSYDYFDKSFGKIDAIQVKRQPGSALKPFTYLMALEKGILKNQILPDIPLYFATQSGSYKPRNYSNKYHGPVSARNALGNSLNIPALYLADKLGVKNVFSFYKEFGLTFSEDYEHYGVGLTLGNAELSLWEMVKAYSILARSGLKMPLRTSLSERKIIERVTGKLENFQIINDILSDNSAREMSFGKNNVFNSPYHLAAKTGTSTLYRDNWAFGYNKLYTVGVWVGNMDQKEMHNVSGITGAAPILRSTFDYLMKKKKSRPFDKSKNISSHKICSHSGKLKGPNCKHVVSELFLKNNLPEVCHEHEVTKVFNCNGKGQIKNLITNIFSQTYVKWAKNQKKYSSFDQLKTICDESNFRVLSDKNSISKTKNYIDIISPTNGAIYGIDPNIPAKYQKIELDFLGDVFAKNIQWYLNENKIHSIKSEMNFLNMEKGNHTLRLEVEDESGNKYYDKVHFSIL